MLAYKPAYGQDNSAHGSSLLTSGAVNDFQPALRDLKHYYLLDGANELSIISSEADVSESSATPMNSTSVLYQPGAQASFSSKSIAFLDLHAPSNFVQ